MVNNCDEFGNASAYCDPCTESTECVQKVDAQCVIYHRDDLTATKLTCIGLPNKTSVEAILEKIDTFMCNINAIQTPITVVDTDSVNMTAFGTINHTIQADVKISEEPNNSLLLNEDGLFAPVASIDGDTYSVDNGLHEEDANNFRLGGDLIEDTLVSLEDSILSFLDADTTTGVTITPSANKVDVNGKLIANNTAWIKSNTSISTTDATSVFGSINASPKLIVSKTGGFSVAPVESSAYFDLALTAPGTDSTTDFYTGSFANLAWNISANQTVRAYTTISGAVSNFQYTSPYRTSGGNIAAHTAQAYFYGIGTLDKIITFRAKSPVPAVEGYSGLVDVAIGLQIERQKALLTSQITDSFAIVQLGVDDVNSFNGPFKLPSTNLSIGTATLVGGTVTVATTAAKTGSKIFLTRNTPAGTLGELSAPIASIVNNTSFVINSSSGTETSTVNFWIIQV